MSASATEIPAGRFPAVREICPAVFAGLISFLVYLATLTPTVSSNDAGRFQIAAPLLGTGHPTGYPTFILFGKLFTFLPFGDVAYRVNLMAAVFGAGSVILLYFVARRIGAGRIPSLGASLLFGFSGTFWSQATLGEVYTMHAFFVLLVTLLLLRWREAGGSANLVLAGLFCGLALGNNAGMVLLAPMFVLILTVGLLRHGKRRGRAVAGGVVAFVAGISVYAYIPIRGFSGAWHNYGDEISEWGDVWAMISGARFQGLMNPTPGVISGNFPGFLAQAASQAAPPFGVGLLALLLAGAVVGGIFFFMRERLLAAAFASGIFVTLLYALSYEINDIAVYYIPVYLLLFVLLAVGFTEVSRRTNIGAISVLPVIFAALVLGLNFPVSDASGDYEERERAEETLSGLPERAILYGKVEVIPLTYLKEVEGERPDITLRWLDGGTLDENFERDLASGRPVYFITYDDDDSYEDYLSAAEEYATSARDGNLTAFEPR